MRNNEKVEDAKIRLINACHNAFSAGLQKAAGGNVSVRIDKETMLVKGAGCCFRDMNRSSFVLADLNGTKLMGAVQPTKESFLHGLIYKCCPYVNAVMHVHSPYATAWSSQFESLPQATWQAKLKMGYDVPVFSISNPVVREEDSAILAEYLRNSRQARGFILREHGVTAMGLDIEAAEETAELIEETAQIAFLSRLLGRE